MLERFEMIPSKNAVPDSQSTNRKRRAVPCLHGSVTPTSASSVTCGAGDLSDPGVRALILRPAKGSTSHAGCRPCIRPAPGLLLRRPLECRMENTQTQTPSRESRTKDQCIEYTRVAEATTDTATFERRNTLCARARAREHVRYRYYMYGQRQRKEEMLISKMYERMNGWPERCARTVCSMYGGCRWVDRGDEQN
ncbi:hypothetical protein L227DRAFT_10253 [Lentinus tigrinus ALCF2SS1-6]|uniref:Uncharacterized protein n=1 Tax=Lentinus tigrinus ALCF2SS1-6 TaxID=1328759 RepID=A0A5C2SVB0_9APHY|nr:hypothetical protein L227DRAFT_10253 [Lentinus tigrinus ALCF2SS1-6]